MNKKQERVLWAGFALIALMGLFPPWFSNREFVGYSFIFLPAGHSSHIDVARLVVQCLVAGLVAGGLFLAFKGPTPQPRQPASERPQSQSPQPNPAPVAASWCDLGTRYGEQGNLSEAVAAFLQATKVKPDDAVAWRGLGVTYFNQGKFGNAIAAFNEAVRINPNDGRAWGGLGLSYSREGKRADTIVALNQATRFTPKEAVFWRCLGRTYDDERMYADAVAAYREVVGLIPNDADAWNALGLAYFKQDKFGDAAGAYLYATEHKPTDGAAWDALGSSYLKLGKFDEAIAAFNKAASINQADPVACAGLCIGYAGLNRFVDARNALSQLRWLDRVKARELKKLIPKETGRWKWVGAIVGGILVTATIFLCWFFWNEHGGDSPRTSNPKAGEVSQTTEKKPMIENVAPPPTIQPPASEATEKKPVGGKVDAPSVSLTFHNNPMPRGTGQIEIFNLASSSAYADASGTRVTGELCNGTPRNFSLVVVALVALDGRGKVTRRQQMLFTGLAAGERRAFETTLSLPLDQIAAHRFELVSAQVGADTANDTTESNPQFRLAESPLSSQSAFDAKVQTQPERYRKTAEDYSRLSIQELTAKAEKGDAKAQHYLGGMYFNGMGVAKDDVEAVKWYRKAAEQNHANAQVKLGISYAFGLGVTKDMKEAAKWYRKAAEQNDATAQNLVGLCYDEGLGMAQNDAEAVKWYRKAAEQNHAGAQNLLGLCYGLGKGVPKDYAEAYKWANLAAAQGNENAKNGRDQLEKEMTPEQIAEGKKRASVFKPKQQ